MAEPDTTQRSATISVLVENEAGVLVTHGLVAIWAPLEGRSAYDARR